MKFGELSEDVKSVFEEVVNKTDLLQFINLYYYSTDKQRGITKVSKLNPLAECVAKKPDTVCIVVNEAVFERLSPKQQKMIAEDCVAQIGFDTEKEKIIIEQPTITMTAGGWKKYGSELAEAYELCLLTAQQLEEERQEAKAAAKEAKKRQ